MELCTWTGTNLCSPISESVWAALQWCHLKTMNTRLFHTANYSNNDKKYIYIVFNILFLYYCLPTSNYLSVWSFVATCQNICSSSCLNVNLRFRRMNWNLQKLSEIFKISFTNLQHNIHASFSLFSKAFPSQTVRIRAITDQFEVPFCEALGLFLAFSVPWPLLSCPGRSFLVSQEVLDLFQRKCIASRTTVNNHTSPNCHPTPVWPSSFQTPFFSFILFPNCTWESRILY